MRSSRKSDAGLACGHDQLQRVESADAAQRWGAVEHPKAGNREECASGRLACAQCAQMGEAESVSQQAGVLHIHRSRTTARRASANDVACIDENGVDCSEVGVDRPP